MKKSIIFILSVFILILSGCETIKKNEYLSINNQYEKKICILYSSTKFRNEIIKRLVDSFKETNILIIVDDIFNAEKYNPQEYNLVVVFSGIHVFFPDLYPGHYLDKYKNEKNIIHVYLTFLTPEGITTKIGNNDNIDTITAASDKKNIEGLVVKLSELIMNKLK